jgi:hypothetical protein
MRKTVLMVLILVLFSCGPQPTADVLPAEPTPPEGMVRFDGCSFSISHPPELVPDGAAMTVRFESSAETRVWILVESRRRSETEQGLSVEELATKVGAAFGSGAESTLFKPTAVLDYQGNVLTAVKGEAIAEDTRTRLLVVVRPDTLLGDMLQDDVVYVIYAQADSDDWGLWGPLFDVILSSFVPRDCGGV